MSMLSPLGGQQSSIGQRQPKIAPSKLWAVDRGTLLRTLTGAGAMIKTVSLAARDQLLIERWVK